MFFKSCLKRIKGQKLSPPLQPPQAQPQQHQQQAQPQSTPSPSSPITIQTHKEPPLDDAAVVTPGGFNLNNPNAEQGYKLPTYPPAGVIYEPNPRVGRCSDPRCRLDITDALWTLRRESTLARKITFETARLQRSSFSTGPLSLFGDAKGLDTALLGLGDQLSLVDKLVQENTVAERVDRTYSRLWRPSNVMTLTNRNKEAEKGYLLGLEKKFQDKVVDVLKEGMIVKGEVDYAGLSQHVVEITKDVKESYQRLQAPAKNRPRSLSPPGRYLTRG
jgi:hypothetical protein